MFRNLSGEYKTLLHGVVVAKYSSVYNLSVISHSLAICAKRRELIPTKEI